MLPFRRRLVVRSTKRAFNGSNGITVNCSCCEIVSPCCLILNAPFDSLGKISTETITSNRLISLGKMAFRRRKARLMIFDSKKRAFCTILEPCIRNWAHRNQENRTRYMHTDFNTSDIRFSISRAWKTPVRTSDTPRPASKKSEISTRRIPWISPRICWHVKWTFSW